MHRVIKLGADAPQSRHKQQGLSLVGLMVGLVISMLAILAAMTLYRSTVRTVYGEQGLVRGAVQDGQLASGLLSAQVALQQAGFGINGAAPGVHILLLRNASLTADGRSLRGDVQAINNAAQVGNALVWAYDDNPDNAVNTPRCQALYSDSESRALFLLRSNAACEPLLGQWNAMVWERHTLIAATTLPQPVGLSARSGANCWPFGSLPQNITGTAPSAAAVEVQLSYTGSVVAAPNIYTSCLANFPA
ncbi:hypothetical protein DBR47_13235 [Paucibacter sp. KBW04]|uniref:PilW family protein n=1 Tax=Paucibacter sp. KBW04 TaxID=2153361 RepID=UPI000F566754|nr:prepilin-type N-terminal cleavage/methylation domain-containing protein [Paucibacter sp. KBW04]RQO58648.1 hypothetical protein DBR47_13235 [Paucibacter sp. KBW04]